MRSRFYCLARWVSLVLLSSQTLSAQSFVKDLTLDVNLFLIPSVHSFAKATLYNENGQRAYAAEVILGHQVADETAFYLRFNSTIITEIGLANSTTGDLAGDSGHCYDAQMIAHANAYNLHQTLYVGLKCIPEPRPQPEVPDENCPILLDLG